MRAFFRILWHGYRCPAAYLTASVVHSNAGRIYSCGCGFEVWEAFDA